MKEQAIENHRSKATKATKRNKIGRLVDDMSAMLRYAGLLQRKRSARKEKRVRRLLINSVCLKIWMMNML